MSRFAVIGLGNFGFHVAKTLFEEGHEVLAIDTDRSRVHAIDPFCTDAIVLDAMDKERLRSLGLEVMECVIIATGTKISTSILICLYLQEFGIKKILAKAMDEDHAKILRRVGATEIIHPEKDMAARVARSLTTPNVIDFIPLSEEFTLVQMAPPKSFLGKSLKDLDLRARYNVYVIAVEELVPQKFVLVPPADFVVKDSDVLVVLGKGEAIRKLQTIK